MVPFNLNKIYMGLAGLGLVLGQHSFGSALSDAAEALKPGEWVELNTSGFSGSFLNTGGVDYVINYGNSAVWDPVNRELRYMGKGHQESEKMIIYYEENNSWEDGPTTSSAPHGYDHNAINPETGEHFYYGGGTTMHVYRNGDWDSFNSLPGDRYDYAVAVGLEYFPERNCLLMAAEHDIYSFENGEWESIQSRINTGGYHMIAEYNPVYKEVYLGGGNGETDLYKVDSDGNVGQIASSPIQIGVNRAVAVVDPVSGELLIMGRDKFFRAYSPIDNGWYSLNDEDVPIWSDSHPDEPTKFIVAAPISDYGVIMFLSVDHGVFLYKHEAIEGAASIAQKTIFANSRLIYKNGAIHYKHFNEHSPSGVLEILSSNGRLIYSENTSFLTNNQEFSIQAPQGRYFFRIK